MKITIDATSTLVRSAGVKNYTYHWITHLRRQLAPGEEIAALSALFNDLGPTESRGALSFLACGRAAAGRCCTP